MKTLIFSLIFIGATAPSVVFGLTPPPERISQDDILNYLQNPTPLTTQNSTSSIVLNESNIQAFMNVMMGLPTYKYLNEEDEYFLTLKEGQTVEAFIQAIKTENQRRVLAGNVQGQLPDPTVQINPTAQGNIKQEPFVPQDTSNIFPGTGTQNNQASLKTPTNIPILDSIVNSNIFGGEPLSKLLNQLFWIGLVAAVVLALIMIIRGGIEYMTIDSITGKENGKKRVQAALGGLVLAFSAILILNTINPGLTNLKIVFEGLDEISQVNINGQNITSGTRETLPVVMGNQANWSEYDAESWVNGLSNGVRSTDGRLVVSVYSATGDAVTDGNTSEKRGFADNLLREGSVALSPDLVSRYQPEIGAEVFINGLSVGFYEDKTAAEYKGVTFNNTIDIYDENKTIGGSVLKNVPPGEWTITFGYPRKQIANP